MTLKFFRPETPPPVEVKDQGTGSVRHRTQSIEEQMSEADTGGGGGSNRSDILNRISKMGQPMLPMGAAASSSSLASEDDIVSIND